ncbi:MAG: helix-turn-helix transcriptional regulator [Nanoarchaeota archaeon]
MNLTELKSYFIASAILMAFIFLVSFISYYIKENILIEDGCGCSVSMPLIIISLSTLGVFVGSITFFFLNKLMIKEKKEIKQNIMKTLDFFDKDEKKILIEIIKNKGNISQSLLVKNSNLDKVKVFRILSKLEEKNFIKKEKNGISNKIILDENIYEIYKDNF